MLQERSFVFDVLVENRVWTEVTFELREIRNYNKDDFSDSRLNTRQNRTTRACTFCLKRWIHVEWKNVKTVWVYRDDVLTVRTITPPPPPPAWSLTEPHLFLFKS